MPPCHYRIVVEGELGPRFATAFEGMNVDIVDGATVITGPVTDPSQLQGLLEQVARLGLTLSSVTQLQNSEQV